MYDFPSTVCISCLYIAISTTALIFLITFNTKDQDPMNVNVTINIL